VHRPARTNFPSFEDSLRANLTRAQRNRTGGQSPRTRMEIEVEARLVGNGNGQKLSDIVGVPVEELYHPYRHSLYRQAPSLASTPRAARATASRPSPRLGKAIDPRFLDERNLTDRLQGALKARAARGFGGEKDQLVRIAAAYHKANKDHKGGLNRKELAKLIFEHGIDLQPGELDELLHEVDMNNDGEVDLIELQHGVLKMQGVYPNVNKKAPKRGGNHSEGGHVDHALEMWRNGESAGGLYQFDGVIDTMGAGDSRPVTDRELEQAHDLIRSKLTDKFGSLRKAFRNLDENSNGKVDRTEAMRVLMNFNLTGVREKTLSKIFDIFDKDGDGIEFDEFSTFMMQEDALRK